MRQHTLKGRGAPAFIPSEVQAHYIDLDTQEIYISRGTERIEDWGNPILDRTTLDVLLAEFENDFNNGTGLNPIVEIPVTVVGTERVAIIPVMANIGKFVRVYDPTDSVEPFTIILETEVGVFMRRGAQFMLYNDTQVTPTFDSAQDTVVISGSLSITAGIQANGVCTVKYVKDAGAYRNWLVFGQTTRDAGASVALAENATRLNGMNLAELLQHVKQTMDDGMATDAELEGSLTELATALSAAATSLNPPAP